MWLARRQAECEGGSGAIYRGGMVWARYPEHWYPGWYPQKCVFLGLEPRADSP